MKTAFWCLDAKLRDASFVLLYIHWLIFGWMLLETLTGPRALFWIILTFVFVFLAGIVSLHANEKKSTRITLTMAFAILFLISFVLIIFIALFNSQMLLMIFFEMREYFAETASEEIAKTPSVYNFDTSERLLGRNGVVLVEKILENKTLALILIDLVVFPIIAFYDYSASVIKSYIFELIQKPQISVIFGCSASASVPAKKASCVVGLQAPSYPSAPNMNYVQYGFDTRRQYQYLDEFYKQLLV